MFHLFSALVARLKALFVASLALDFESEFAARDAERKAELLRQAEAYEKDGLSVVADELRQCATEIDLRQPLASILPSLEHWQAHSDAERTALADQASKSLLQHVNGIKKRRSYEVSRPRSGG